MEVVLFTISITISAFLLFWVQPLAAKFFLPLLGGTPSVWQTCMVFFQGMLLLGYGYAHYLSRQFELNKQLLIHLSILLIALGFLPFFTYFATPIQANQNPNVWLLTELLTHIALPFFVISASAPLLQRWFSYSRHIYASDPYYLYAASNLGSLLALLSFPFLLEPLFGNYWQNILWAWGYIIYSVLLISISILLLRSTQGLIETPSEQTQPHTPIPIKTKMLWIALAFVPSSLLLGVTTTITTDIASTPLFWVIPLMLYLGTFILSFNPSTANVYKFFNRIQPYALIALMLMLLLIHHGHYFSFTAIFLHLFVFVSIAFICHGQLYQSRPHQSSLTEFYLFIAVGGFLGGVFNSILSPTIFNAPTEYPLVLCLACLLRPTKNQLQAKIINVNTIIPVAVVITSILLFMINRFFNINPTIYDYAYTSIYVIAAIALLAVREEPINLAAQLSILLFILPSSYKEDYTTVFQYRNFFGILKIREFDRLNLRSFIHGTTIHGVQHIKRQNIKPHQSYYVPLKHIAKSLHNHNRPARIAVAGLGAGSLACIIGRGNRELTFYEIDPDVIKIAGNNKYFHFINDCKPKGGVIVGDARISLEKAKPHYYDLIVLDAFTSDAVPTHLINLQAISLYLNKLAPYGSLAFNISNRHLDLVPVLSSICNKLNLQCYSKLYLTDNVKSAFDSKWVLVTRPQVNVTNTLETSNWHTLSKTITKPLWTDDYSNIVSLIK